MDRIDRYLGRIEAHIYEKSDHSVVGGWENRKLEKAGSFEHKVRIEGTDLIHDQLMRDLLSVRPFTVRALRDFFMYHAAFLTLAFAIYANLIG